MLNNSDFNSALALFQSLYKSHKGDIFTIVERFILVGVRSQHLSSVTIEKVSQLLRDLFNIEIPKTIIQKCVNNQQTFQYKKGEYIVVSEPQQEIDDLLAELNEIDNKNDTIVTELYEYIEHKNLVNLSSKEREEIREVFFDYIKDREIESNNKYFLDITQFIIYHEGDNDFLASLDAIKEGMIIYRGIRYSETTDAKTWKNDTTFFLDMEYLFSSFGLNGSFYKECFFDFYDLVREINEGSPSRMGKSRIKLMFFSKTKDYIDRFFSVACRIKDGEEQLYNNSEAMEQIINHCTDATDVLKYKSEFYKYLNDLGIEEYNDDINLLKHKNWLFETNNLMEKAYKEFAEDTSADIKDYLLYADYINILREGRNYNNLERCPFMFLSASTFANRFSKFLRDNDPDVKTLVICKMDIFTEKMWFKLRKGIVDKSSIATFKVLFKAKSVVSSFLSESVLKSYNKIKESNEDIDVLKGYYAEIRSKRHTPENINAQNVEDDIAFVMDGDSLVKYKEEQTVLKSRALRVEEAERKLEESQSSNRDLEMENQSLKKQLRERDYEELLKSRKRAKAKFWFEDIVYKESKLITWAIIFLVVVIAVYLDADILKSPFGLLTGIITILGVCWLLPPVVYKKMMIIRRKRYKKYIMNELFQ